MDDGFGQSDSELSSAAKRSRLGWGQGLRRKAPNSSEPGPSEVQPGDATQGEQTPAEAAPADAAMSCGDFTSVGGAGGGDAPTAPAAAQAVEAAGSGPPEAADAAEKAAGEGLEKPAEERPAAGAPDEPAAGPPAAAEARPAEGGEPGQASPPAPPEAAAPAPAPAGEGEGAGAAAAASAGGPEEGHGGEGPDALESLFRRTALAALSERVRQRVEGSGEAGLPTKEEVVTAIGRLDAEIDRVEGLVRRLDGAPEPPAPPPPAPGELPALKAEEGREEEGPRWRRPRRDVECVVADVLAANRAAAAAAHGALPALPDPAAADPELARERLVCRPLEAERRRRLLSALSARAASGWDLEMRVLQLCVFAYRDFGTRMQRYEAEQRADDRKRKEQELRSLEQQEESSAAAVKKRGRAKEVAAEQQAATREHAAQLRDELAQLRGQPDDDRERWIRGLATIPKMEARDPTGRPLRLFRSSNALVEDPLAEAEARKLVNPWSPEEEAAFVEHYLEHPKDFGKISSLMRAAGFRRSVQDCAECYYRIKMREKLKGRLKVLVQKRQKPKFRGNPNRELLALGVDDVKHVIEEGGSRQARRIAEAAKRRAESSSREREREALPLPLPPASPLPPPLPPALPLPGALPGGGEGAQRSKMSVSSLVN